MTDRPASDLGLLTVGRPGPAQVLKCDLRGLYLPLWHRQLAALLALVAVGRQSYFGLPDLPPYLWDHWPPQVLLAAGVLTTRPPQYPGTSLVGPLWPGPVLQPVVSSAVAVVGTCFAALLASWLRVLGDHVQTLCTVL